MWGGPTPHNLVTLSLCCAVRTCSEVPITSLDRDTTEAREGRPHSPSLGHPCPGAGSSFTQREVPYDWVSAPRPTPPDTSWDHAGDTTHFGRNENKKKDYGRTAQSHFNVKTMQKIISSVLETISPCGTNLKRLKTNISTHVICRLIFHHREFRVPNYEMQTESACVW